MYCWKNMYVSIWWHKKHLKRFFLIFNFISISIISLWWKYWNFVPTKTLYRSLICVWVYLRTYICATVCTSQTVWIACCNECLSLSVWNPSTFFSVSLPPWFQYSGSKLRVNNNNKWCRLRYPAPPGPSPLLRPPNEQKKTTTFLPQLWKKKLQKYTLTHTHTHTTTVTGSEIVQK